MSLPDHLIGTAYDIVLWRHFLLRSAGFPAAWATQLHSDELVEAARAWNGAREQRAAVLEELAEVLEKQPGDRETVQRLRVCLDRVACHRVAENFEGGLPPSLERLAARGRALEELYEREQARLLESLRDRLGRGRIREAIAWESPAALHAVDKLLSGASSGFGTKERKKMHTAVSYLQRLCMKNDSVGFFGPIAWGSWTEAVDRIELDVGNPLVTRHEHHFEPRALSRLSRALEEDERTRTYIPVWRLPSMAVEGEQVRLPLQPPQRRTPVEIAVLTMADGSLSGVELSSALIEGGTASALEAPALIERLISEGLVSRSAELPQLYGVEAILESWLARMPDEVAAPHRQRLDRALAARDRVADACGDADRVRTEIESLEQLFEDETGAGRQGGGAFYEARSPVFQEAERNARLRLGRRMLDELSEPLSALSPAVRWYVQTLAERVETHAGDLLGAAGRMEFLQLLYQLLPELGRMAQDTALELRQRWHEAVGHLEREGFVEPAAARAAVQRVFPRPPVHWELGRRCSPDLMIASRSLDAIQRGDYVAVLGELHVAANSAIQNGMIWLMNPDEVVGWTQSECRRPSLLLDLQESLRSVRIGHPPRAYSVGWLIPHANNRLWSNDTVVPLAEVHVESDESGRPFCRSLDRQWKLADALNGPLNAIALGKFSLFEPSERAHRLQIGRLLVRREHWSTRGSELKFVRDKSAVERFAGMRKWSDDLGLPRHVFVRFQGELKPVYFDLHSPLYAELLCKLVRALPGPAASVSIGEMVPGPEDLWLHDADGQRYTSELRMVMVDAEP